MVLFMKVKVIKFDHFGRGIALINKKIVFIHKALPDEVLDIKIVKEKSKYSEAIIERVLEKSKYRIEAVCPYYALCGGCYFLHANYELEKDFKINKACELLGRCDHFYETKEFNYRNKVVLHIKNNKLGFYQEKTNELVNINYCYLLDDHLNKVISDLGKIDKKKLKEITIKTHNNQILLNIKGKVDNLSVFNYVDTIINNGENLKGKGYIEENIERKIFKITSEAFFQVNKEGLINI